MSAQLPEGTHLAYIVMHEAYWADVARKGEPPAVVVQASARGAGGGVAWEFEVEDRSDVRPGTLRLNLFEDAWQAFTQIPEFFAALDGEVSSLDALRALLDRLGAVDETERHGGRYR